MSRVLMNIEVRGKVGCYGFEFYGDPKYLREWRADGLSVIVIENTIPEWAAGWPRAWCFLQDVFNFRNPWRRP